jgi:hypothetical protein
MNTSAEAESRSSPDGPEKSRRPMNPESLKNLRRGDQPPERHVEAMAQALDLSAVAEDVSLYEDMKHVRRFPKAVDRTEGQRDARKWKDRNLSTFLAKFAELEKAANGAKPSEAATPPQYLGEGPCPACNREPEKELRGPEFMADEFEDVLMIAKHREAILRILPHIDQFDAWLALRTAG